MAVLIFTSTNIEQMFFFAHAISNIYWKVFYELRCLLF